MTTQRIFSSRSQHASSTYIGNAGQLFYNETSGLLRLSDGSTPGGLPISVEAVNIVSDTLSPGTDNIYGIGTNLLRWNHIHLGDGGIYFDGYQTSNAQTTPYIPSAITEDIIPSVTDNSLHLGSLTHRWGDVYIGRASLNMQDETTGANVAFTVNNGTLYLNGAANLAIGNLIIEDTTLKTANSSTNINIGTILDTGLATIGRQTVITTPNTIPFTSALLVNGATTLPIDPSPLTFNGTMIHTVAQAGQSARIVQDSFGVGNYPIYVGRMARGNIASPSAASTDDILLRLSGNGYGSTGFATGGTARIDMVAVEPYTNTAKGSKIVFWTTPAGTTAITNNASVTSDGFVGNGYTFTADGTRQTTAGIPLSAKAISSATYVATLGIDGKLDASQIPSALTGAIVFKGVWNADTNTPTLSNTLPAGVSTGWEYIVDVPGTRDIGDGSKTFLAGDFVIYDGTHWKQVPSGNAFISLTSGGHITVNQTTGAMVLGSDATPNLTTATIVSRDASGNFFANMITANLTGNVTGTVSGNAGSVTNGVYITGNQIIDGIKTFTSTIQGTITTATIAASIVGGVGVTTLTAGTGTAVSASTGSVTVWNTIPAFNTSTLVATAVTASTANKVANSLTAGFGLALESGSTYDGSAAHTLSALHGVTGPVSVVANAYALDLGAANGLVILNNASQANYTITISNPTPGKVVRVMNLNMKTGAGGNTVTVSGLTAANSTNGNASFQGNSNGAVAIVEFYCTTTATSGVYMNTGGAK